MRSLIVLAAAIAAFSSVAAHAQTYSVVHAQPYFSFGFGYPGYYGPPVTGSVFIGGGWHDGWGHRHWR